MTEFKDALKSIRKAKGLTQEQLGKKIGVSSQVVSNWERGYTTSLSPEMLNSIAGALGTTPEVFLGLQTMVKTNYSNYILDENSFFFISKVRKIMEEEHITIEEFMKRTGYYKADVDALIYGNKMPSIEDVIKIAGALNVSTDYLLDLSERKKISVEDELLIQTITARERELVIAFRELCHDNQDIIMGEIKKSLKEQYYEKSVAADEPLKKTGTTNSAK